MTIDSTPPGIALKRAAPAEQGFSLMEAMVVLIVAGVALTLLFSVAGRAAQIGFGLGGRALGQADAALAEENLRVAVRALSVPPLPSRLDIDRRIEDEASPLRGDARGFSGPAVFDRPTVCADRGPARPLQVRLERRAAGDALVCESPGQARTLLDLQPRRARLSYSGDGVRWSDRWPVDTPPSDLPRGQPQTLYIRLTTDDGAREIIERARTDYAAAVMPPQTRPQPTSFGGDGQ